MGGSRFMGVAVVAELLARGHEVLTFNRGTRTPEHPGDVRQITGDRNNPTALARLAALEVDGIVDLSAYTAEQTRMLLDVQGHVPRFVHISSGAVYAPQPSLPWREDTPFGPWELWGDYAAQKLACERLLRTRRPPDAATIVLRFPYVLGPRNYAPREEFVLNRLLDREELLLPGDGKAVQQFVSARQAGQAMAAALECFDGGGFRGFNVGMRELVSLEGFVHLCAQVSGAERRMRAVGGGANGNGRVVFDALDCVFPFPNENYVLDVEASRAAGIAPDDESVTGMIEAALEALLAEPERRRWERTLAENAVLGRA
jgi:2'-hydroxyisoflavone reductase